uniref:Profilin n=1 Tax=Ornithorhynchus anatinus TaxID=9258 RepID=F7C1U4_ORNAN
MTQIQNLLIDSLLGTKHVENAAIIKLQDQSVWVASPGFNVSAQDAYMLISAIASRSVQVRREGLYFTEKDYKCVRADEYSLYAKRDDEGVVVAKTDRYLVVGTYNQFMYPSVCVEAVEKLGKMILFSEKRKKIDYGGTVD